MFHRFQLVHDRCSYFIDITIIASFVVQCLVGLYIYIYPSGFFSVFDWFYIPMAFFVCVDSFDGDRFEALDLRI